MKAVQNEIKKLNKKDFIHQLKVNYVHAMEDPKFIKLVNTLKIKENIACKYTSHLKHTLENLTNCDNCKGLINCHNEVNGFVYYPKVEEEKLDFNYVACKYKKSELENYGLKKVKYYEIPRMIKEARMGKIDTTDKSRMEVIKWLKKFYDNYDNEKEQKGLYLTGSFGSGKTYLVAALLNELALKGVNIVIVYYPEFLLSLKNFGSDFSSRIEELKKADIILLDDIGAESVTAWSRDEILGTILQYRMDNNLTTFFTSNYKIAELENKLSFSKGKEEKVAARRIIERIKQLSIELELIGVNRRK